VLVAFIVYALPIVRGQSARAASIDAELTGSRREEYERLNRAAEVRRHMEWVQTTPTGDLLIVMFESNAPQKLARPFEDTPYDRWWRQRVTAIHGFDPGDPEVRPVMPLLIHTWTDPGDAPVLTVDHQEPGRASG
jgi:hypothetical protein